jgi:hypothetical protein
MDHHSFNEAPKFHPKNGKAIPINFPTSANPKKTLFFQFIQDISLLSEIYGIFHPK